MNCVKFAISFGCVLVTACVNYGDAPITPLDTPNITETRWRYFRPLVPDTLVLDIKTPIDVELCVDNKATPVTFMVSTEQCGVGNPTTTTVTGTGCAALGHVRRVSIPGAQNQGFPAAGGSIRHANFDADPQWPIDNGKIYSWSYTPNNPTTLYKDPNGIARIVRVCVAAGQFDQGWAVNFKMRGHPCSGNTIVPFTITGVQNAKYGVENACGVVQAKEIWIEEAPNPEGRVTGTYQFLR
ncbi:hypothetical protein ACIPLA_11580 [Pseudomonas sp. NPDC086112]|uniref:hypothetical protein n=1 Tax=Pseudomonas sp. NPDC086112 TaxID=3364430 RepID=UPI003814DA3D